VPYLCAQHRKERIIDVCISMFTKQDRTCIATCVLLARIETHSAPERQNQPSGPNTMECSGSWRASSRSRSSSPWLRMTRSTYPERIKSSKTLDTRALYHESASSLSGSNLKRSSPSMSRPNHPHRPATRTASGTSSTHPSSPAGCILAARAAPYAPPILHPEPRPEHLDQIRRPLVPAAIGFGIIT
jgi:hypothetical protein